MSIAQITFRREEREGVVAVGSYLADAAKRFGIRFEDECLQEQDIHFCAMVVTSGAENMSPLTSVETEHFSSRERKTDERLACQTKIETAGEVIIMTHEKKEEAGSDAEIEEQNEKYKKDFTELPLEGKIAALVQLEAIALSETVSFVMNSPYLVFDKVMDVMAEFGLKKEEQNKKAARPKEHEPVTSQTDAGVTNDGKTSKRRSPKSPAAE